MANIRKSGTETSLWFSYRASCSFWHACFHPSTACRGDAWSPQQIKLKNTIPSWCHSGEESWP